MLLIHNTLTRENDLYAVNQYEDDIEKLGGKLSDLPRAPITAQTIITFPNGYGVSFISPEYSFGLEAAILTYEGDDWTITYDTPITDDVVRFLDDEDILPLLEDVSKLPNREQKK